MIWWISLKSEALDLGPGGRKLGDWKRIQTEREFVLWKSYRSYWNACVKKAVSKCVLWWSSYLKDILLYKIIHSASNK